MALTYGQQRARNALAQEQNRSAEDYTNDGTSGWDAVGRLKYSSDIVANHGVGGIHGGSVGLENENYYKNLMAQGPQGLKIGDFLTKENNGLDPSSLAYGQAVKDKRVGDLQKSSDWWDVNPEGEAPSWLDKHGFALTAVVMSMGVGAALMGAGAAGGALAGEGAGGVGAGAIGTGVGEVGAAGAGATGLGGAGAVGSGLGELGAAGAGASAAIPTVTITGAAGGGAGAAGVGGLGSLGTAGAVGGAAAGLGSMVGGGEPNPVYNDQQIANSQNNTPNPDSLSQIPGNAPAASNTLGQYGSAIKSALGGGSGGSTNWGSLINSGLGLIGGNVDRIKANQDAEWWKGQLDTLGGMYKPGTPEATLMQKEMEAKDAAAGRRSQYGIRATDLAAKLAQQRAQIMTSAGYQNMANAYRNRSSQDLNGLFSAAGNMGGSNGSGWNAILNGLGSYFGGGSATPTNNISPPPR